MTSIQEQVDAGEQPVGGMENGFTHASSVIPVVRSSDEASLIDTQAFVPLNTSALPYMPAVVHLALEIVPVFPFPEASATVVPMPSLKLYAAIRPETVV